MWVCISYNSWSYHQTAISHVYSNIYLACLLKYLPIGCNRSQGKVCSQMWPGLTWQEVQFFWHKYKATECTSRFQCPVITGVLLLAAFSWPTGDHYEMSVVCMVPWQPVVWAVGDCQVSWCCIKTSGVDLPSFQSFLSHQWSITRPISSLCLPDSFYLK